jgi:hypothetical protein
VNILSELAAYRLHSFACDQFFDSERSDMEFILSLSYTQDHAQVMQSWNELKHMLRKNAKVIPYPGAGVDSLSNLMIGI